MTSRQEPDLDALRSLIQAAAATGPPARADVETVDYDWRVPSHFSRQQLAKLDELAASLAEGLSAALGGQLHKPVRFEADPAGQYFRLGLQEVLGEASDFRALLGADDSPAGVMLLGGKAAAGWVTRLLGGQAKDDRQLSGLEADLLADIAARLIEAISEALDSAGAKAIGILRPPSRDPLEPPGADDAEYCTFSFKTDPSSQQADVRLAVFCELLDPIAEADAPGAADSPQTADSASLMIEHFARAPVTAYAVVGRAEVTVRELMSLEAGDVILLPKRLDDPVELCVEETAVSSGRAVLAAGRCAVEISRVFAPPPSAPAAAGDDGQEKGTQG